MFDLNAKEGMDGAVTWTNNVIRFVKDGGIWAVPRSGTIIKIDRANRVATRLAGPESFSRVFEAMGWTWKEVAQ